MKQNVKLPKRKIAVWCAIIFCVYVMLVVSLYFLMGEQLHFRTSRGNVELQKAVNSESVSFDVVTQRFTSKVQRLQIVSVAWPAEQPSGEADIVVSVLRADGSLFLKQETHLVATEARQITSIVLPHPDETTCDQQLVIEVQCGGWIPEFRAQAKDETLLIDGTETELSLNFEFCGQDYVWTGLNYWWIALVGLGVIAVIVAVSLVRHVRYNNSLIINCFESLSRYKFLISQLVARDFKSKYKRSFFGVLWSFLNPLLTTFVMYFVFSNIFRGYGEISNYTAYLIIGVTMFNFFSESCSMCLDSIVGNSNMINKVYVPKYIYPLTKTLSSGINFAFALIPLLIVVIIQPILPSLSWILALFPFACMLIFCYGLGMLLATAMVFFRDTKFLWGVVCMMWMYLTPIFYPADIIPEMLRWIQQCNPMYLYISFARTCIISGVSPEPAQYVYCLASALVTLVVGGLVFKKKQNSFVLYI